VAVRTDLPEELASPVCQRLNAMEEILDAAFPFLGVSPQPLPLTLVLNDPGRFELSAKAHGFAGQAADAFVCERGELYLRYRSEAWSERWSLTPPYPLEPRSRPLAAATLSRRLVRRYGELETTWLETGLQAVFVDLVAQESGDDDLALRGRRERLLDAYLPLYLGAPPALARLFEGTRGGSRQQKSGSRALAWAVVGFLLADATRTEWLGLALDRAAGHPVDEARWASTRQALARLEGDFERYLRGAVLRELLATFLEAPTPVDRWEAAAALRLLANLDLDAEADDELRRRLVAASARLLDEQPLPPRFLDEFASEIARVRSARSRLQAQRRLNTLVRAELERRAAGYGHPEVEAARRDLGKAVRRALESE
jgi:hypothetical protein